MKEDDGGDEGGGVGSKPRLRAAVNRDRHAVQGGQRRLQITGEIVARGDAFRAAVEALS